MHPQIRVVIAEDHPVVRHGIQAVFRDSRQVEVVGEAKTGQKALQLVEELQPDVLLLDLELPDISGVEVAEELHRRNAPVRVLVLSAHDDVDYVHRLQQVNVVGYLLKDEASWILEQAVEAVARGETGWFSRTIKQQLELLSARENLTEALTEREMEVLRELATGKSNNAISLKLHISEKTVEKHLEAIYRKLSVRSRTEAAVLAARHYLV